MKTQGITALVTGGASGLGLASAMRLVAAIEADFNVRLTTKEIMKMRTIGIARAVLKEKGVTV